MSAESEFLAEIVANPRDLTPRLIYADWLEENGDPRGEFIRIQCELAEPSDDYDRRERLDNRQDELRRMYERDWTAPIRDKVTGWSFRCGFVESVEVTAEDFLKHEDQITGFAPIRRLTLLRAEGQLPNVMERRLIPHLEAFRVERSILLQSDTAAIRKTRFPNLHMIHFVECNLTDQTFEPLLQLKTDQLRDADFSINKLRNASAAAIADSLVFSGLTELNLMANEIRQKGAIALARSSGLNNLQYLDIRGNKVDLKGMEPLVRRFGEVVRF